MAWVVGAGCTSGPDAAGGGDAGQDAEVAEDASHASHPKDDAATALAPDAGDASLPSSAMDAQSDTDVDAATVDAASSDAAIDDEDASVDPGPTQLVSITPAHGAKHVFINTTFVVKFSGPIDESSLGNVELLGPYGDSRPITVTYDAVSYLASVDPVEALSRGQIYDLKLKGVLSSTAEPIDAVTAHYETAFNEPISSLYYSKGAATAGELIELDAEGRRLQRTNYSGLGKDAMFGGAGDVVSNYEKYTWSALRDYERVVWTPLVAGQIGDMDTPTYRSSFGYTTSGTRSITRTVGMDGKFLTDDDGYGGFGGGVYDSRGLEMYSDYFSSVGVDGMPFTPDDVLSYRFLNEDLPDNWRKRTHRTSAGTDAVWFTADDVIAGVTRYQYNATGRFLGYLMMDDGADNVFDTPDDGVSSTTRYLYDAHGVQTGFMSGTGPGPDGIYLTDDDVYNSQTTYTLDANAQRISSEGISLGPDGQAGTSDDVLSSVTQYDTTR